MGLSTIGLWTSPTPSGPFRTCSIPTRSPGHRYSTGRPARRALYALPMGRTSNHVHVWKSLLERAGFTLEDIPKEWEAFWSSGATRSSRRCARRPAATTSGASASTCRRRLRHLDQFSQFLRCLRRGLRDPRRPAGHRRSGGPAAGSSRRSTATPPSTGRAAPRPIRSTWDQSRQQQAVPGAGGRHDPERDAFDPQRAQARAARGLLQEHCHDRMAARPVWRGLSDRRPFRAAAVFKDGRNTATAKDFVRFLVAEGWLAH